MSPSGARLWRAREEEGTREHGERGNPEKVF